MDCDLVGADGIGRIHVHIGCFRCEVASGGNPTDCLTEVGDSTSSVDIPFASGKLESRLLQLRWSRIAAAEAMRRILVEQARRKLAVRHGGEWNRISKLDEDPVADGEAEQTVIIHDLLDHLGTTHPRQVEVAKMRMFLQLTFSEIAEVLGLSADTTESDWNFARAWLKREWDKNQIDRSI